MCYLAPYYQPTTGRFLTEDPFFGGGYNPNDPAGLNIYNIMQSSNLYVYCINNPIMFSDPSGEFIISTTVLLIIGGAALVGTIGGFVGNHIANQKGLTGWDKAAYIAGGVVVGAAIGAVAGYFVAPAVISSTGVIGLSITKAGITVASPWALDALTRGNIIEKTLGGWNNNFPAIDKVGKLVNGIHQTVTSIKSIDLAAKSYQTGNTLYNTIMGYANSLSDFSTTTYGGFTAYVGNGTQKILEIAIPTGATQAQMDQINRAIAEAAKMGIEIVTRVFQ